MFNKKYILPIILATFFLTSCEDMFQRSLDAKISDEEQFIVMHGVIEADSLIEIKVSKSFSFFDDDSLAAYLPDAKLKLSINNAQPQEMTLSKIDKQRNGSQRAGTSHFVSQLRAKAGDKVRVEASAPKMKTVWAEVVIPTPPAIGDVETEMFITSEKLINTVYGYVFIDYSENPSVVVEPFYRNLRLNFPVKASKSDVSQHFYLNLSNDYHLYVPLYTKDDPIFANNPQNSILDFLFEKNNNFNGATLFSDQQFKDGSYTLNVVTSLFYRVNVEYKKDENGNPQYVSHEVLNPPLDINIIALSPEYYTFLKLGEAKSNDAESIMGFISEPRTTYSNVENGAGVIGAKSIVRKRISTPPYPGEKNSIPRSW